MRVIRLVVLVAGLAALPSSAVEPDPWARVPALPAGCYQQDGFGDKVSAAHETLKLDLARQEKLNDEMSNEIKTIEPMELAQRQQKFMMEHPQEAMQLMQRNQQVGQDYTTEELAANETRKALERELEEIDARYKAALDKQMGPINAKFEDLDARAGKDPVRTEAGDYYAPWAAKEWNALLLQENAVYEKVCAEWWAASGPYQGWLKKYREHLVRRIPQREEAENVGAGFMVHLVGTPTASFRPTSGLRAVGEYMDMAAKVFAKRRGEPGKPQEGGMLEVGSPRR